MKFNDWFIWQVILLGRVLGFDWSDLSENFSDELKRLK